MIKKQYFIAGIIVVIVCCLMHLCDTVLSDGKTDFSKLEAPQLDPDKNDLSIYIGKNKEEVEKELGIIIPARKTHFGKLGFFVRGTEILGQTCYLSNDDVIQAINIISPVRNPKEYHIDGIYCDDLIDNKKSMIERKYEKKSIMNDQFILDYYISEEKEQELFITWEEETRKISYIVVFKPEFHDTFLKMLKDSIDNPEQKFLGILENSDTEIIDDDILEKMLPRELFLARWEIYARHGLCFSDPDLEKCFYYMSWYRPNGKITDPKQIQLNKYEKENVRKIDEILKTKKGKENNYSISK